MNNKKYDDFFDDLDKTTDLLKAFKPHVDDASKLDELDTLFAEINNQPKKVEPKKSTPVIDDKKQIKSSSKKETNNVKNTQTKRTIKEEPIKNNKNVVKQNREQTDIKQIMHKLSLRNENKVKPKKTK